MAKKRLAKAKSKRAPVKKIQQKKVRPIRPPNIPAVETVILDVIEEPIPGVMVVTEFEAVEVEPSAGPEQPEESQGSAAADTERR